MEKNLPRVFMGSSKESLHVLQVIADAIQDISFVVAWTDQDQFRRPGDFFLDSLIQAANSFDLAILVLGKDDVIFSRKKEMPAPRDNVVFELGLFMSVLDRRRTIIVSPRVWKEKLKILSDLGGLNLSEYDFPRKKADLSLSLQNVVAYIRAQIQRLHIRPKQYAPAGVSMVWSDVEELLASPSPHHYMDNIALDMEMTWRWLHDHVLNNMDRHNITVRMLFLDHRSAQIAKLESESVSIQRAKAREEEITGYFGGDLTHLHDRSISVSFRAYQEMPVMHGILIDERLFLSACAIENGKLIGAPNPYLVLERPITRERDVIGDHFHRVFRSWFEHLWAGARIVCNT